jgi:hypothetical protein
MHVLYPLLNQLGSSNVLVSQSSVATLHRIMRYCRYTSLSDMLVKNADYIVDSIAAQLRAPLTNITSMLSKKDKRARKAKKRAAKAAAALSGSNNTANNVADNLYALFDDDNNNNTDNDNDEYIIEIDNEWTTTLPRVLQALLLRTGAATGPTIIPLLDDVLQSVLDALGDGERLSSTSLPRDYSKRAIAHESITTQSYLEVLHSVVVAIRAMPLPTSSPRSHTTNPTPTNTSSSSSSTPTSTTTTSASDEKASSNKVVPVQVTSSVQWPRSSPITLSSLLYGSDGISERLTDHINDLVKQRQAQAAEDELLSGNKGTLLYQLCSFILTLHAHLRYLCSILNR